MGKVKESVEEIKEVKDIEVVSGPVIATPKVPTTVADSGKPFLDVEVVTENTAGILDVYNLNPNYVARWCLKVGLPSSNRKGIWHVLDKTHPDFKGLRVNRDDTPSNSFITCGDLILTVSRKDTVKQLRSVLDAKVGNRTVKFENTVKHNMDKMYRDSSHGISKGTLNKLDALLETEQVDATEI